MYAHHGSAGIKAYEDVFSHETAVHKQPNGLRRTFLIT